MNTIDSLNTLSLETFQTAIDSAYLVQKQTAQLTEQWHAVLESNQKANRELATTLARQSQEAQSLWFQLFQESFRTTVDTVAKAGATQLENVSERVDRVNRQANGNAKKENATK